MNSNSSIGKCRLRAKKIWKNGIVDAVLITITRGREKKRTLRIPLDFAAATKSVQRGVALDRARYEYSNIERRVWNVDANGEKIAPELDIQTRDDQDGKRRLRLNLRLTAKGEILALFYGSTDDGAFAKIEQDAIKAYPSTDPQYSLSQRALNLRDNTAKAKGIIDTFHCVPTTSITHKADSASKFLQPTVYEKHRSKNSFGVP